MKSNMITKTLGAKTYALRASPKVPWTATFFKTSLSVLSLPFVAPLGLLWAVAMVTPLRDSLQGVLIPRIMSAVDKEFHQERATLLAGVSGKVLDVGSGGGAYLRYCQGADEVVAVEPIQAMHPKILQAGKDLKKLSIVKSLDDLDENDCFEWVIFGNVLCEVPHVQDTVRRVDKFLKLGGRVYFSEHIGRPRGTWQRSYQDFINPVWKHIGGGCNCNRDSLSILQSQSNWDVVSWTYDHVQVAMGPFALGLALKMDPDQTSAE
jgi:SAM-dependent methyltransferase